MLCSLSGVQKRGRRLESFVGLERRAVCGTSPSCAAPSRAQAQVMVRGGFCGKTLDEKVPERRRRVLRALSCVAAAPWAAHVAHVWSLYLGTCMTLHRQLRALRWHAHTPAQLAVVPRGSLVDSRFVLRGPRVQRTYTVSTWRRCAERCAPVRAALRPRRFCLVSRLRHSQSLTGRPGRAPTLEQHVTQRHATDPSLGPFGKG